jgi:hypothetical protein
MEHRGNSDSRTTKRPGSIEVAVREISKEKNVR